MRDIVEMLRDHAMVVSCCCGPQLYEAITAIVELREQAHYANGVAELAMKHRDAAEAENERLRKTLGKIAHPPDDIDAPHYPVSIARAALKEKG